MNTVDVVIPCYNYARYLEQCVRSVLSQEGVRPRVLIIDDASKDNTALVAEGLARADARVTFIRHPINRGNIATYNEGIDWATSELFLLLSADDYLVEGALARASAVFDARPDVVLVCGEAAVAFDGEPPPQIEARGPTGDYDVLDGASFIDRTCADSANNPVWTPTAVVRTTAQKAAGGYDSTLPHAGDLELWLRLASLGAVARLKTQQAVYRRHGSNMHYSYGGLPNLEQHRLAFESFLRRIGASPADASRRTALYRHGLALGAVRVANDALNRGLPSVAAEAAQYAVLMDPRVRFSNAWLGMWVRRLIGPRLLGLVRDVLRRGIRPGAAPQGTTAPD